MRSPGNSVSAAVPGLKLRDGAKTGVNTQDVANEHSRSDTPVESMGKRQPLSSKSLAPLVKQGLNGSETPGPDVPPKSARMVALSPFMKGPTSNPSLATNVVVALNSAEIENMSAKPTTTPCISPTHNVTASSTGISHKPGIGYSSHHRRWRSEGNSSVAGGGRATLRLDESPSRRNWSASIAGSTCHQKMTGESLPPGRRPVVASTSMSVEDIDTLRKQAIEQASRFGVLRLKDVDMLSRGGLPYPS